LGREAQVPNLPQNFGINEFIKIFPAENKFDKNHQLKSRSIRDYFYGDFKNQLNNQLNSISLPSGNLNVFFLGFEGPRYPKPDELRFLSSRTYSYSDIIPFPVIRNLNTLVSAATVNRYLDFLKEVYDEYSTLNYKPIMGIIPKSIPDGYYKEILKFYVDHDITSFFYDFEGSYPGNVYPQIRVFFRELNDLGITQESKESVIYAFNPGQGRIALDRDVIEARDIIAIEYGFDILGRPRHIGGGGSKKIETKERKIRYFDKTDYGYYRISYSQLQSIYPKDSSIPINAINAQDNLAVFNMEQKAIELCLLRQVIAQNRLTEYIDKKTKITEDDRSQIKKMKKDLKEHQTSLFS
jgi:hypothetical protein